MGFLRQQQAWWVLSAQAGNREALNALFKSIQTPLFRYIQNMVNDQSLAEDILQEVFIRIYRKLSWLKEPDAFRPWAYQIATREVFRHMKRERRWAEQIRDEDKLNSIPDTRVNELFPNEVVEVLPKLVGKLPPRSRAVISLRYLHEMSLLEIAAVLALPLGTVKSRLSYGLQLLRRELENLNLERRT